MYGIKASFCYYNFSMCPLYDITMVHISTEESHLYEVL